MFNKHVHAHWIDVRFFFAVNVFCNVSVPASQLPESSTLDVLTAVSPTIHRVVSSSAKLQSSPSLSLVWKMEEKHLLQLFFLICVLRLSTLNALSLLSDAIVFPANLQARNECIFITYCALATLRKLTSNSQFLVKSTPNMCQRTTWAVMNFFVVLHAFSNLIGW